MTWSGVSICGIDFAASPGVVKGLIKFTWLTGQPVDAVLSARGDVKGQAGHWVEDDEDEAVVTKGV